MISRDKIIIRKANIQDADIILHGQREAFSPSYQRYHDKDNPSNVSRQQICQRIEDGFFYIALMDDSLVGAIFISRYPDEKNLAMETLFTVPECQNMGIGQMLISYAETLHIDTKKWITASPSDRINNCHLYEKNGYMRTGREIKITDDVMLIFYEK